MPRRVRLFVPGAIYHVYCRISRGEMIFQRANEAECLVSEIKRVKQRDGWTIFAFAVLSNHYHLSLRTDRVPLWVSMLSLQARVARGYNRHRGLLGPLWQSRYKARIVEDQSYFDQLVAYIHLNPVSAGIVDDPADYRWSGHAELIGAREAELIDVYETLVSYGRDRHQARQAYQQFVRCCAEERWSRKGVRSLPWWSPVSDDEELVEPQFGCEYEDYRGSRVEIQRPSIDLTTLIAITCEHLGVSIERLSGRYKGGDVTEARKVVSALAVGRYGQQVKELSRLLNKNPSSVSRWLTEVYEDGAGINRHVDEIDRLICIAVTSDNGLDRTNDIESDRHHRSLEKRAR